MPFMSVSEYADYRGVSRQAVNKAIRDGRITETEDENGKRGVISEHADKSWDANTRPSMKDLSYSQAKIRSEEIKTRLFQLKYDELMGKLVPIEEIVAGIEQEYTAVKAVLLAIPTKLAVKLSTVTNPIEVKKILDEAINEALGELQADARHREEQIQRRLDAAKQE
jgi:hypothetical protein